MIISKNLIQELQNRLKVGNRRGVHLNAIPKTSKFKLDLKKLSIFDHNEPNIFIQELLGKKSFEFRISSKDKKIDLFNITLEEQKKFLQLEKSFENLSNQVETIKSEKGINTFGFGFPLLVRKNKVDNKIIVAPVFIWSLHIRKDYKNDAWIISRKKDDPITLNEVMFNHLSTDLNIDFSDLLNTNIEDFISKENLTDICKQIYLKLDNKIPESFDNQFDLKLANITTINTEKHYEGLPLNIHTSFLELAGLFSIFEVQKHNVVKDYEDLLNMKDDEILEDDIVGNNFQYFTKIDTDPSQQAVLNNLNQKRNIIIQGPPGTGKSQTLTAILVNALESNKKILVVCEKSTALEVLANNLEKVNLSHHSVLLHDIISDRLNVVNSFRDRIENISDLSKSYLHSDQFYNTNINYLEELKNKINKSHQFFGKNIIGNDNWTNLVGKYLNAFKRNNGKSNITNLIVDFDFTIDEMNLLERIISEGDIKYKSFKQYVNKTFINIELFKDYNIISFEDTLKDKLNAYSFEVDQLKKLVEELKMDFINQKINNHNQELDNANVLLNKITDHKFQLVDYIKQIKGNYITDKKQKFINEVSSVQNITKEIDEIIQRYDHNQEFLNDAKLNSSTFKFCAIFSKVKKKIIEDNIKLNQLIDVLSVYSQGFKYLPIINLHIKTNINIENYKRFLVEMKSVEYKIDIQFENDFLSLDLNYLCELSSEQRIIEHLELIKSRPNILDEQIIILNQTQKFVQDYFKNRSILLENLKNLETNIDYLNFSIDFDNNNVNITNEINYIKNKIDESLKYIKDKIEYEFLNANIIRDVLKFSSLNKYKTVKEEFDVISNRIIQDNIFKTFRKSDNINSFFQSIEQLISQVDEYFRDYEWYNNEFEWFKFYNNLDDKFKIIIDRSKDNVDWNSNVLNFYIDKLLKQNVVDEVINNENDLEKFLDHKRSIEQKQIDKINKIWYKNQELALLRYNANNPYLQAKNLYNKRGSNGISRNSLRKIVEKDIDLFTTYFPIILTTPEVASNLFRNRNKYFDIIIFDEASQLRLEDNLPAMMKGKQIIIAGDEHQMPPSSFFTKIYDGQIDNEDDLEDDENTFLNDKNNFETQILNAVSLLDFASLLKFENISLDFHYRSKHPDLIEFSNAAFYNSKLVALPPSHHYKSIQYDNVDGAFIDRINKAEAIKVLEILQNEIHPNVDGKYPTLGIATFNIEQRNYIKKLILEKQQDPKLVKFSSKISKLLENGLFVKNLENIQGDERDIIIISTTYGKDKEGKQSERYGLLNFQKGYKLLNVIVTRAKKKCFVVTSIAEEKILNFRSYLIKEGSNNRQAVFMAYLAYAKAISEDNTELKNNIIEALKDNTVNKVGSSAFLFTETESPFEDEVYQYLAEYFGEENLYTQYKFGGFRVDIVYDFKVKGVPKLAIECDGAKYHSSDEAYLNDIHRQKILEQNGFVFHRIWSTNWWRNPKFEFNKLKDFIESFKDQVEKIQLQLLNNKEDEILIEEKISDEILFDENERELGNLTNKRIEFVESSKLPFSSVIDSSPKVKINSIVKVKYIFDNKIVTLKIVEITKEAVIINDIMGIYYKTPIAQQLLGKEVGIIVAIPNTNNSVEILEII